MFVINKHLTFSLHGSKWLFSSHLFFPNFSPPRSPGLLCFRINVIITISFTTESHEPWIFNAVWDSERKHSLPGEGREHWNPTFWKKPRGGWHFCSQQSDTINSCLGEHWPQLRCDAAALTGEPAFIYQDETSLFKHWDKALFPSPHFWGKPGHFITLKALSALENSIKKAALQLGRLAEQDKAKDAVKKHREAHEELIAPPSAPAHSHHKIPPAITGGHNSFHQQFVHETVPT